VDAASLPALDGCAFHAPLVEEAWLETLRDVLKLGLPLCRE